MSTRKLVVHGMRRVLSALPERLYLATGIDKTRPITIRGTVTNRCNYRCMYCSHWRLSEREAEMSFADWERAVRELRSFVGSFVIQFDGGEPFIRRGFVEFLSYCADLGIGTGFITNGSCLTRSVAERVVAARPLNMDISVDAAQAEIHDRVRGITGSLAAIERGIDRVREAQERMRVWFPMRIKTTVHALNRGVLAGMVPWVRTVGATTVDYQPVRNFSAAPPPEIDRDLWIHADGLDELQSSIDELILLKEGGAPIETPVGGLRRMVEHFRGGAPVHAPVYPCRAGLQSYRIGPDGNVRSCFYFDTIGNVRVESTRSIWYGDKARRIRRQTVECRRSCAFSCLPSKSIMDLVGRGAMLLKGRAK